MNNIVQKAIVPYNIPLVDIKFKNSYYLYSPVSTYDALGISKYDKYDFNVNNGTVKINSVNFIRVIDMNDIDIDKILERENVVINIYITPNILYRNIKLPVLIGYKDDEPITENKIGNLIAYKSDISLNSYNETCVFMTEGKIYTKYIYSIDGIEKENYPYYREIGCDSAASNIIVYNKESNSIDDTYSCNYLNLLNEQQIKEINILQVKQEYIEENLQEALDMIGTCNEDLNKKADISYVNAQLNDKINTSQIRQSIGQSMIDVMSQKAVTDNLNSEINNRTNADSVLEALINQKLDVSKIKKGNSTFLYVAGNGTKLVHTWNAPATGYLIFYFGTWYGSERIKQVAITQGLRPVAGTETMVSIEALPIGVTFFGRVNTGDAINMYTTSDTNWGGENTGYIRYLLLED